MTNAIKAGIIAFVNALLALVVGFGVPLTSVQIGLIGTAVNAGLALWVLATHKNSAKRIPDV